MAVYIRDANLPYMIIMSAPGMVRVDMVGTQVQVAFFEYVKSKYSRTTTVVIIMGFYQVSTTVFHSLLNQEVSRYQYP